MSHQTSVQLAVRRLIKLFDNNQTKAGKALGISQSVISQWLTGVCGVSAANAFKIESCTNGAIKAWELCLAIPKPDGASYAENPATPEALSHAS